MGAVWEVIQRVSQMPQLHAVIVGTLAGVAATYALAKFLPADMDSQKAKRITALVAGGVTLNMSLLLSTTIPTFAWAFVSAMAAPALHGSLVRYLAHKWPWAAPESVMDASEVEQADRRKREIVREMQP